MPTVRITATAAARQAIRHLSAGRGAPVMIVQSGGCSTPMCYPDGEFLIGPGDVLLGEIEGSPFYLDRRQARGDATVELDVAPGGPEGFSLPAGLSGHFVTRSTTCAT
jgi:uncharacterized protein (DUF779 family)